MRFIHLNFLLVYLYHKLHEAHQDLSIILKCNFLQKRGISQLSVVASSSCLTHLDITVVSLKLIYAAVCCGLSAEIWCALRISWNYMSDVYVIHICLDHSK